MKNISRTLLKSLLALALALELFILNTASVSADALIDPITAARYGSPGAILFLVIIVVIIAAILLLILKKLRK